MNASKSSQAPVLEDQGIDANPPKTDDPILYLMKVRVLETPSHFL